MVNDSIGDFLIRVKNGYGARHKTVSAPYGKQLLELGKLLAKQQFIEDIKVERHKEKQKLVVTLSYPKRRPALTNVERISKPGLRIYVGYSKIPLVFGGIGMVVLSTPKGLMTGKEAVKKHLGGELLCKVW